MIPEHGRVNENVVEVEGSSSVLFVGVLGMGPGKKERRTKTSNDLNG